ncbi:hypothetical protein CDD80_4568 [Ophiocordyceps camponoti-rufipedis]|uniref:RRM domain-containing protein n=1 Tax=Ophiocordyceps camponoti-rufipedis TaxID=2004952 RepID=A0A2C5Y2R4_9HYPO|nr:hypothetical protein CDD80_4568 [Ophiocordyceps camponoti-rufipedis]
MSASPALSRRTDGPLPPDKGKSSHHVHPQRPSRGAEKASDSVKSSGEPSKRTKSRSPSQGEKLIIRRLPPGMTEAEFVAILGSDWEVNKGKVDWFSFCPGKVSVDPSKQSRPGRAYLHLTRKDDMMALSQVVRAATWEDAKLTFTSPALVGPPSLEFATYKKIPSTRRRGDPRQGTIDQDPEFMAFLEGLANPVPYKESVDVEDADDGNKDDGKITTTPLIEYLREKKANKGKETAKNAKGKAAAREDDKKKTRDAKGDKSVKTAAKEPVKILMKKAAAEPAPEVVASPVPPVSAVADAPKGRRAGIAAAARILQRDLGLSPGSAHRRARHDAAKAEAASSKEAVGEAAPPPSTTEAASSKITVATKQPQAPGRRVRSGKAAERGKAAEGQQTTATTPVTATVSNPPVMLRKRGDEEVPLATTTIRPATSKPAANGKATGPSASNTNKGGKATGGQQKKAPTVTAGATRAFVKHANASQGVTEASLRQALEAFGAVTQVEVDKRKGFAYVDFADHDGLVKAMGAGTVQVAQSAVQVVERRDKKPATGGGPEKGAGRGRRGRGGGGGGGGAKANGTAPAAVAATTGGSG